MEQVNVVEVARKNGVNSQWEISLNGKIVSLNDLPMQGLRCDARTAYILRDLPFLGELSPL